MNTEKDIGGGRTSVIIHGPQGCGKTLQGQALARHFRVKHWGDLDELPQDRYGHCKVPALDHLLFSTEDPREYRFVDVPTNVRVIPFVQIARQLGLRVITRGAQ